MKFLKDEDAVVKGSIQSTDLPPSMTRWIELQKLVGKAIVSAGEQNTMIKVENIAGREQLEKAKKQKIEKKGGEELTPDELKELQEQYLWVKKPVKVGNKTAMYHEIMGSISQTDAYRKLMEDVIKEALDTSYKISVQKTAEEPDDVRDHL